MPSGACVIRREGVRGVVLSIKYIDAAGRQVKERLGRQADGWNEKKAKAELEARLTDVRREGLRKPRALTFATFADEWLATYPDAKALKRSTRESYETIIERHLKPRLGHLRLEQIDAGHLERYLAGKRREGLQPRTLNRQLNLLNLLMTAAVKQQLVRVNPVGLVDRPREPRRRWTILSPTEVGRVERAFVELAHKSPGDGEGFERAWLEQARVVFLTVIGAGLRRGEILGLRWRESTSRIPRERFFACVRRSCAVPQIRRSRTRGRGRSRSGRSSPKNSGSSVAAPLSLARTSVCSAIPRRGLRSTTSATR